MIKVQVLMSTYNGEKFLEEQVDSILKQKDVEIDLLVRDDGSKDNTLRILENFHNQGKLDWYTGENLRPAKSFMNLIENSGEYDYYAFSDQDDFWMEDKLISATKKMELLDKETPAMYCSDKEIVDSQLKKINHKQTNYKVDFESAMIRNIATGCTMVMNNSLVKKIRQYKPEYITMHDSWIYRVCLAIDGNVIYDREPHIKYRQHENNVIGANEGVLNKVRRRWQSLVRCDHSRKRTAEELLNGYQGEISEYKERLLKEFAHCSKIKNKISLLKNKNLKTESKENNVIFKLAVLINKI